MFLFKKREFLIWGDVSFVYVILWGVFVVFYLFGLGSGFGFVV